MKHALVYRVGPAPCTTLASSLPQPTSGKFRERVPEVLAGKGSSDLMHRTSGSSNSFASVHHLAYYRTAA